MQPILLTSNVRNLNESSTTERRVSLNNDLASRMSSRIARPTMPTSVSIAESKKLEARLNEAAGDMFRSSGIGASVSFSTQTKPLIEQVLRKTKTYDQAIDEACGLIPKVLAENRNRQHLESPTFLHNKNILESQVVSYY